MLPVANPAFNLLILKLLLQTPLINAPRHLLPRIPFPAILAILPFLGVPLPRHARPENDVLAYAGGVKTRARGVTLFEAEFRPRPSFGYTGVDGFANNGCADAAGGFHLFAGVVEGVCRYRFGAVFIRGDGLWG